MFPTLNDTYQHDHEKLCVTIISSGIVAASTSWHSLRYTQPYLCGVIVGRVMEEV